MTGVSQALLGRTGGERLIAPTVRLFLSAPRYSVHRWTLVRRPSPLAAVLRIGAIEERFATCQTAGRPFHRMAQSPFTTYGARCAALLHLQNKAWGCGIRGAA